MPEISADSRIGDIPGVAVGHWSADGAKTGCTVLLFEELRPASIHIAGGAPGSAETDLLREGATISAVDAILLTGGSAFGLAAAAGVRRFLEERGRGFTVGAHAVPLVPAAVIFDLGAGDGAVRPGDDEGYTACAAADTANDNRTGAVGAGTGARIGKYLGDKKSVAGGLSSRSVTLEDGVWVGALMVANAYGAIFDPATGEMVAGPRDEKGTPLTYFDAHSSPPSFGNTSIGVVVTDAGFDPPALRRIAMMAHTGLARSVNPVHTPYDGDIIFAVSVGGRSGDVAKVGAWSARLVERCMVSAVAR